MHFLLVVLVLAIATLVTMLVSSSDFDRHALRYVPEATYSRNDMELGRTGLGLAITGGAFFVVSAGLAVLVQAAFGASCI